MTCIHSKSKGSDMTSRIPMYISDKPDSNTLAKRKVMTCRPY